MNEKEKFIALMQNQSPKSADAIILLQGDGLSRAAHTAKLFHAGVAPVIVLTGGADDVTYGSIPSRELKAAIVDLKVPEAAFLFEETSTHTRAEADRAMELAKENNWKSVIIVTSPHHKYRAYLTFLQAMKDAALDLVLNISEASGLSWFSPNPWGKRADLLEREFERIQKYQEMGHVASFAKGIEYLEWKEQNQLP